MRSRRIPVALKMSVQRHKARRPELPFTFVYSTQFEEDVWEHLSLDAPFLHQVTSWALSLKSIPSDVLAALHASLPTVRRLNIYGSNLVNFAAYWTCFHAL
ncbi:hypothetical protein K438DRAFT_1890455 [Mycena galopus ATCC 62051]|nr:hypothetical protein K438DRAFT_1890455 [Mycena galopus ATCC 62051]